MVNIIGHIIKAMGKTAVNNPSKIQTEKIVKTAQSLVKADTGTGYTREQELAALQSMLQNAGKKTDKEIINSEQVAKKKAAEEGALKAMLQKAHEDNPTGNIKNTNWYKKKQLKNDKLVEKKIKKVKKIKDKVLKEDKKRIISQKFPVVKRKGHYKKTMNENQPLTPKDSGVNITSLNHITWAGALKNQKPSGLNHITWAGALKNQKPSGLNHIEWKPVSNTITANDLKPFAFNAANKAIAKTKNAAKKKAAAIKKARDAKKKGGMYFGIGSAGILGVGALGNQPAHASHYYDNEPPGSIFSRITPNNMKTMKQQITRRHHTNKNMFGNQQTGAYHDPTGFLSIHDQDLKHKGLPGKKAYSMHRKLLENSDGTWDWTKNI